MSDKYAEFQAWAKSQGFSEQDLQGPLHELWPCWLAAHASAMREIGKIQQNADAVSIRHTNLLLDLHRLAQGEDTLNDFPEVRALQKKIVGLTNLAPSLGPVKVYGVKNGEEVLLGRLPLTPRMRAKELAAEMFGYFQEGDDSTADLCFTAMELLLEYLDAQTKALSGAH